MNVVSIGGGPAGLYFSILLKKALPTADIRVVEKNRADDTFGWGVVFSKETLGNFAAADPETYAEIERAFAYWDDIETYFDGACTTSTGHGFCGLSRKKLLQILQARAAGLGVSLEFEREIPATQLPTADLILAADGVHSPIRERFASVFAPSIDHRRCKFIWLGTSKRLRAFTFVFKNTPHGLFQVHAYPFDANTSTWIVECREEVWRAAGLDKTSEAESVAFLQKLFEHELAGHPLLANKSIWRTFPTIRCQTWHHENIALMGDAVHTAHFSIGSGTKLAMEDAISLARHVAALGPANIRGALEAYEAERKPEVAKLQKAAQTSLEWFENSARYLKQAPWQFTYNLLTRSQRITHENLRVRDPAFVARVEDSFAKTHGTLRRSDASAAPPMFTPYKLRDLTLPNRVVVSPMCQYSAVNGDPNDWHFVHLASRALGGAGLLWCEATGVSPEGRITPGCTGLWNDTQLRLWKRIVDFVHQNTPSKIGIQLGHAGRKASCARPWEGGGSLSVADGAWQTLGPSALPFIQGSHTPRAMGSLEMKAVTEQFVDATVRAQTAGFDAVELHAAHGYLLSSFLSPLSNQRTDEFGGSLENRLRFPLRVFDAIRAAWPKEKPTSVRISATDWLGDRGLTGEDAVQISRAFREHGADIIDVSAGGNVPESKPEYGRMFQVKFADAIRHEAGVPVIAVGNIQSADHANMLLASGRADLVALARGHLSDPYFTHRAAQEAFVDTLEWPKPYLLVKPGKPPARATKPSL